MPDEALEKRFELGQVLLEDVLFVSYQARDRLFRRECTVHLLRKRWARNKPLGAGMLEAIRLASTVHDAALPMQLARRLGDDFIVVTDAVPRWLLARVLESAPKGRLKERQVLMLGRGLAKALRALHEADQVHGDLRPEVVWLDDSLNPLLLWAGVANSIALHQEAKRALADAGKCFAAPELLAKTFATRATDIYGLGALLYYVATGSPPVEGDSASEIAVKLRARGITPPSARGAAISPAFEACLMKCLAHNPQERYQSMDELLRDLDKCAGEYEPAPAQPKKSAQPTLPLEGQAAEAKEPPPFVRPRPKAKQETAPGATTQRVPRPAPEETQTPEQERSPNVLLTMGCFAALIFIIAVAVLAAGYLYYLHTMPPDVAIPNVIGKTLPEAKAMLAQANLKSALDHRVYASEYPPDTVVDTYPAVGTKVKAGHKVVRLVVSAGAELAVVPDLQLKTPEQAKVELRRAHLEVGPIIPMPKEGQVGEGTIQAQVPSAGTRAEKGTSVALYVASSKLKPPAPEATPTIMAQVKVQLPSSGSTMHSVRVEVLDLKGPHIAYQSYHLGGETCTADISWQGKADLAVYVDDVLAKHMRYHDGVLTEVD